MNLAFHATEDDKPRLPGSLHVNRMLSQWLEFAADGTVLARPGKVELGQGILTALTQIVAEELDVAPARVRLLPATTGLSPNEAVTSGSLSVQESGMALRHAAADARGIFLSVVAQRSGISVEDIRVEDGAFIGPAGPLGSYWEMAGQGLLEAEASPDARPKPASARRLVGLSMPRLDLPAKIFGQARFVHDIRLPGMLHARMVRPPSVGARLLGVEPPSGARLVRDGSFLAVVAATEEAAERAAEKLQTQWSPGTGLPENTEDWLRQAPGEESVVESRGDAAPVTITREFHRPFIAHASVGLCCAVALWNGDAVTVWSHTQGPYNLRADLAKALGLAEAAITVVHAEGAGCYGHNGADDVALDAALCARAMPGVPVRALWSRAEELGHGPLSPAMLVRVQASTGPDGAITHWASHIRSNGHSGRPGRGAVATLLAAPWLEGGRPMPSAINPPLAGGGGAQRNAVPIYAFANLHVGLTRITDMPVRASALRGLGALINVWSIESVMDELAEVAGQDPVEFRLRHLSDPRARAVLEKACDMAGWPGEGMGVAVARYKNLGAWCAVVARVEATERVRAKQLWIAADMGEVINPCGAINQLEGGALHGVSVALHEQALHDGQRIISDSWEEYPVLRFADVPRVTTELIIRPEERPLGAGEASMAPAIAAIAGGIFSALGTRPNRLPFIPENL